MRRPALRRTVIAVELAVIHWRDAHFAFDDPTVPDEFLVRTVGWILGESEHFLTVASEEVPDGGHRAISHIPLESILDVVSLELAPSVALEEIRTYPGDEIWGVTA